MRGSNTIERISLADAIAIVDEEKPHSLEEEAEKALTCFRVAMTYVLSLHDDPHAQINAQLIRSLHFMMLNYDLTMAPGRFRHYPIQVVRGSPNEILYKGPEAPQIPGLIEELVIQINSDDKVESSVVAAMAHLNLMMIFPFHAGNGQMALALQTLVLTRNTVLDPVFCSIEEWLGHNANAYHAILGQVGKRGWHPERDALPWVRFCLVAHYQQTAALMKRNIVIGRMWSEMEKLRKQHGLLERTEIAMMDAAFNYRVINSRYRKENKISEVVASRDLRELCDMGLLIPIGEKRGRYYLADVSGASCNVNPTTGAP